MVLNLNQRAIMSNVLHYLVHLVGRLLRVRDVRDRCVTVFGGIRRDNRHVSQRWLSSLVGSAKYQVTNKGYVVSSNLADFTILLFSNVRAGDIKNGYYSVLLDTSSVWREDGPGDHCCKTCEIRRTRKHIFCWFIALPTTSRPHTQRLVPLQGNPLDLSISRDSRFWQPCDANSTPLAILVA